MFIERTESLKTNFFPLDCGDFDVQCFAKKCNAPNEPRPNENTYRMVVDKKSPTERQYWISPCCCDGFKQLTFNAHDNPMPAKWVCSYIILEKIAEKIRSKNPSYMVSVKSGRFRKLEVRLKKCEEVGWQGFIVEFDWHSVLKRHGVYVNFHFSSMLSTHSMIKSNAMVLALMTPIDQTEISIVCSTNGYQHSMMDSSLD